MKINAITVGLLVMVAPAATQAKAIPGLGEATFWRESDVEINVDGTSHSRGLVGQRVSDDTPNGNWNMNGRIRLGVGHTYMTNQGVEIDVFAQPLLDLKGGAGVDDASISFAGKDSATGDWKLKLGRYEAFDMFPLNQDTFIEYSGNTSNKLYSNASGYSYQMKEGRGRSSNGGGILVAREVGPFYLEANTLIKDGTKLFEDGVYHGREMEQQKNVVLVRPVIAYNNGPFTVAVAGETNLVHNAYGYKDANGKFVDQSSRNGYGLTLQYDTLKAMPDDGITLNLSAAQLHANGERDLTVGVNGLYKHFELGFIYANNNVFEGAYPVNNSGPGHYKIHTLHASYNFTNVAGDPNMNVNLGAYTSYVTGDSVKEDDIADRYGIRAQAKYYF